MAETQFISDCWTVVRALGEENVEAATRARVAWGLNPTGATCYRDKFVEIVAEAAPSKRLLVTKLDTKTPVVCTDSKGAPSRWHGETRKLAVHVRLLVAGLQED